MGLRFRKSLRIMPGVRVNLSGSGVSTSVGRRGAMVNIGKKGMRLTVGLPGTGLSHSQWLSRARPAAGHKVRPVQAASMGKGAGAREGQLSPDLAQGQITPDAHQERGAPATRKGRRWPMLAAVLLVLWLLWLVGRALPA